MKNTSTIIFDFDGVIHDTFDFHLNEIKNFTNFDLSEQIFRDMHNGNFFHGIPEEIKNVDWSKYGDYIYEKQIKLIINQDVKKSIDNFSKNYDLHIISSAKTRNILGFLDNNNISDCFIEVLGFDIYKSKIEKFNFILDKHKLENKECVFITDTLGDIKEANKVDIKTFAVDFGFHAEDVLKMGNPYKIVSSFEDIII